MAGIDIATTNISGISPREKFFIDTNVLAFLHFGYPSPRLRPSKIAAYSNFISGLLGNGNDMYVSALTLQELLHLLERLECARAFGKVHVKTFRAMPAERAKLETRLKSIVRQIYINYKIVDDTVGRADIDKIIKNYSGHSYDPMDFIVVDHHHGRCVNFITDDADFRNDNRIKAYFCN
jgi:predicted nucleic acid-binding protein